MYFKANEVLKCPEKEENLSSAAPGLTVDSLLVWAVFMCAVRGEIEA